MGVLRNIISTPRTCNRCQRIWALIAVSNLALIFEALRFLPPQRQKMLGHKIEGAAIWQKNQFVIRISTFVTSPRSCSLASLKWLYLHATPKDKYALKVISLQTSRAGPREKTTFFFFFSLERMESKWIWCEFFLKANELTEKKFFRKCHWLFKNREMGIERDITLQF